MSTPTLTPAAADVLRRATATETTVVLPAGQLDRSVYVEVNKALERIGGGGKWNRSAKAHIFSRDPRPELDALAGSGLMPVDKDKEMAFFRTPPEVAEIAVDAICDKFAGCDFHPEILEPSAGDGALADMVRRRLPHAYLSVVEPETARYSELHSKAYGVPPHAAWEETFEEFADGLDPRFDAVIMNPPFSLPGHPVAWAEHVMLAWGLLKPGGHLVAVIPDALTRTHRLIAPVAALVAAHGEIVELPAGSFKVSGTGVSTALIVLDKQEATS